MGSRPGFLLLLHFLVIRDNIRSVESAPPLSTPYFGALAQLIRAPALQAGGRGFESLTLHHFYLRRFGDFLLQINNEVLLSDEFAVLLRRIANNSLMLARIGFENERTFGWRLVDEPINKF